MMAGEGVFRVAIKLAQGKIDGCGLAESSAGGSIVVTTPSETGLYLG